MRQPVNLLNINSKHHEWIQVVEWVESKTNSTQKINRVDSNIHVKMATRTSNLLNQCLPKDFEDLSILKFYVLDPALDP